MAHSGDIPQEPATTYQMPDWETPLNRPKPPSLLTRLTTPMKRGTATPWHTYDFGRKGTHSPPSSTGDAALAKETSYPPPAYARTATAAATTSLPHRAPSSFRSRLAARIDTLLPPHRTYLGRLRLRRRTFLTLLLLLAVLVLLILILGLALGLRHRSSSSQQLPLPNSADPNAIYTGDLTYFAPGLGACGWTSDDNSTICAVSHLVFDAAAAQAASQSSSSSGSSSAASDPNANPLCGRQIRIERDYADAATDPGNRTAIVTVVDRCTGCGPLDLDLSPGVFDTLANATEGRVLGSWSWLPINSSSSASELLL